MRTGPAPKNIKHGSGGGNWTDVPNVAYTGARPKLPETAGMHWFPQVEAWWEVFTTMPHCVLWEASDWLAAVELAYMKNAWWGEFFGGQATTAMATEIRRREDNMGGTMEARRKLLIRYVDPPVDVAAAPATADGANVDELDQARSRRARLAG